jgi:serpin B
MTDEKVMEEFVKANNSFLPSVYKEIVKKENGNLLVSPLSAQTILALTFSGCRGETAEELRIAVHFPDDPAKIQSAVKAVLSNLKTKEGCKLCIANKMYVTKGVPLQNEFQEIVKEVYFADSENIDFTKKVEAAEIMNSWVEKETENKISNLIDSRLLNELTRIVLINTLYFKGDWKDKFHLAHTKKMNFYKTPNETVEVDAMSNKRIEFFSICISEELNAKVLKLPIHGDASMMFVLPNERDGLAELENKIDKVFSSCEFSEELVSIFLPKFKIEYQIDFKAVLENLGVQAMFSDEDADLSGIAGEKGELLVDAVLQKTFIDVSEEGVEAAAATFAVIRIPMSGYATPPVPFIADHPFIFYIKVDDVIIFAGRVTEPHY